MNTYYKPEYLKTLDMLALRAHIIRELRKDPPELGLFAFFTYEKWMADHLTPGDLVLLHATEVAVGKEEASKWFADIIQESGIYQELLNQPA